LSNFSVVVFEIDEGKVARAALARRINIDFFECEGEQ